MMTATRDFYPPPSSTCHLNTVHPRQLYPLREPPEYLLLYPPILPVEAQARTNGGDAGRAKSVSDDFAISVHVIPASYPRVTPFIALPPSVQADLDAIHSESGTRTLTKDERKKKTSNITNELLKLKARHIRNEKELLPDDREDRLLWNCVTRYYRRNRKPGAGGKKKNVTLLLLHANGLHKETWEPFLRHLISYIESSKDSSVSVDEIWALEATQHGDAAIINQDKFGVVYDWQDHSRDILNFLSRYLPLRDQALSTDLPVHLPRIPREIEDTRLQNGFTSSDERTLVAVGHSLGGATVTLAAITHPRLFSALILVDPVIVPPYVNRSSNVEGLALGAVRRRHTWPSREEARKQFSSTPFFAAWDPEVLDAYVQFGLITTPSGGVILKMPGIQEAVVFSESRTAIEIFELLKDLDPSVHLHWIMAGKGSWITGSSDATRDVVWHRPVNASNTQLASEHLVSNLLDLLSAAESFVLWASQIVQQAPKELAHEVQAYLQRLFSTTRVKSRL